jgi:hypothetical protein
VPAGMRHACQIPKAQPPKVVRWTGQAVKL